MGVQTAHAQNYNTIFQQYLATTNGEILTIVNENNIQFDEQKNIYSMVNAKANNIFFIFSISSCAIIQYSIKNQKIEGRCLEK
jgi:hypothetical protein